MDVEDKRRYFAVLSVFLEFVTPLFQQKLEEKYQGLHFGCLRDFLDKKEVIHILFHLHHRNGRCCTDKANCTNHGALPLNHHQWKQLYAENEGPGKHNCFCEYKAKSVKPEDLDLSLCGLILYNCCNLEKHEKEAVHIFRRHKNDYLSHNIAGGITKHEYDPLMDELKTSLNKLDHTKEDELIRIQTRTLDDALCNKYKTILLDIHEIWGKFNTTMDESTNQIKDMVNIIDAGLTAKIEEYLGMEYQTIQPYKLGQSIFTLHHQIDLTSVISGRDWRGVTDIVLMDDGRLVMCLPYQWRLLICNTDGSQVDSIPVRGKPGCVTAVNNSTVAVTLYGSDCIEMYDINNKHKLKSISVPEMKWDCITTINNKLVVGGDNRLLSIDHQEGDVVQTIQIEYQPGRLHGSGDRIFYFNDNYLNNKLYWYNYADNSHHYLKLPSAPASMTTLQDGSMYLVDEDVLVQHVSSDGQQYRPVTTKGIKKLENTFISYNSKQRKLVTIGNSWLIFKVFNEK